MFKRDRQVQRVSQTPANRMVNRILTYGLIGFIIYAIYNNSQHNGVKSQLNSAAAIACNSMKAKNILSGKEVVYNLENGNKQILELTPDELNKIDEASFEGEKPLPVYEIEFGNPANCNQPLILNQK